MRSYHHKRSWRMGFDGFLRGYGGCCYNVTEAQSVHNSSTQSLFRAFEYYVGHETPKRWQRLIQRPFVNPQEKYISGYGLSSYSRWLNLKFLVRLRMIVVVIAFSLDKRLPAYEELHTNVCIYSIYYNKKR